jgi:hypothetical protein
MDKSCEVQKKSLRINRIICGDVSKDVVTSLINLGVPLLFERDKAYLQRRCHIFKRPSQPLAAHPSVGVILCSMGNNDYSGAAR